MTAYMLWLQDTRSEIKADNPGISMIDISRKAGTLWKTLPSIDKKVCTYVRMYVIIMIVDIWLRPVCVCVPDFECYTLLFSML